MKQRIGLLGGISYESTIIYYRLLMEKYFQKVRDYYYPEIVIVSLDFQRFTDYENTHNTSAYIDYIVTGVTSLQSAGAQFVAMAANSPHAVFAEVQKRVSLRMINIVEVVAEEAKRRGIQKALLLGIKFTMQSSFYRSTFSRESIEIIVPREEEQEKINSIIFNELVIGKFNPESKKEISHIIESYETDAVILGCTELPLLIGREDTNKIVLNPLELHVDAILKYSIEGAWRK